MKLLSILVPLILSTVDAFAPQIPTRSQIGSIGSSQRSTRLNAFVMDPTSVVSFLDPKTLAMLERNAVGMIDSFYQTQPYLSAFVTCSVKASAADLVAQKQDDGDSKALNNNDVDDRVDIRRNIGFLLYGGLYQGMVQEYLYNTWFPSVFGDSTNLITVLEQVMLDMIILSPFLCLPVAYLVKASIAKDQSLPDGLQRYVDHVQQQGLLFKYWALWAPVQCLTFGVIPQHLRIVFTAFVSFFWLMILSTISSRAEEATTTTTTATE